MVRLRQWSKRFGRDSKCVTAKSEVFSSLSSCHASSGIRRQDSGGGWRRFFSLSRHDFRAEKRIPGVLDSHKFWYFLEDNSKEYFLRHLSLRRRLARPCFTKPHGLVQGWPKLGAGVATPPALKGRAARLKVDGKALDDGSRCRDGNWWRRLRGRRRGLRSRRAWVGHAGQWIGEFAVL
jgi:hypothetical protein